METIVRVLGEISELALSCPDQDAFWREVMQVLRSVIGFDAGHLMSTDGDVASAQLTVEGHSEVVVRTLVPGWLAELPGDLVGQVTARATSIFEVTKPKERGRYALFREFYQPAGTKSLVARVHWSNGRATGYSLERTGHTRLFGSGELRTLDALVPLVALGDRYILTQTPPGSHAQEYFHLTRREAQITDLVVRGLQNSEIAQLLRISPNTVRNALHSIFRKAHVSTRAELAFVSRDCAPDADQGTSQLRKVRAASRQLAVYLHHIKSAAHRTSSATGAAR